MNSELARYLEAVDDELEELEFGFVAHCIAGTVCGDNRCHYECDPVSCIDAAYDIVSEEQHYMWENE